MGMKFTQMPVDAFEKLQLNAGILVDAFVPATGEIGNILGATSGGIQFNSNPSFEDFGEDVDNCPPNMKELKRLVAFDPQMAGTFLTCTPSMIAGLIGAADVSVSDTTKVVPRQELESSDFEDLWWIGDYSDVNSGSSAGFLAIHLLNALNQSGFQIQSGKNAKGQMAFEYHGHYSMNAQDTVPFEIYCKGSGSSEEHFVLLDKHSVSISSTGSVTLKATTNPVSQTVTWTSGSTSVATVSDGVVSAEGTGNTLITASMTYGGVTYTDTCTVVVTS